MEKITWCRWLGHPLDTQMAIFVDDPPMRRRVRDVRLYLQRMVPNCSLIVGLVDVLLKSIMGRG